MLVLRWHVKDGHVRDGHVKNAAQDVAEDVTRDVAEDVLGAAEGGSSSVSGGKIIITPVAYRPRRPRCRCRARAQGPSYLGSFVL